MDSRECDSTDAVVSDAVAEEVAVVEAVAEVVAEEVAVASDSVASDHVVEAVASDPVVEAVQRTVIRSITNSNGTDGYYFSDGSTYNVDGRRR